jgi:hypothetical protein
MIYFTQLIYIKTGQEKIFDEFENVALAALSRYNGRLLLRLRPEEKSVIEKNIDTPYEIHIVEMGSDTDFHNFSNDPERKAFLHLKEKSIAAAVLYKGIKL